MPTILGLNTVFEIPVFFLLENEVPATNGDWTFGAQLEDITEELELGELPAILGATAFSGFRP
jgi:hypothetical protein